MKYIRTLPKNKQNPEQTKQNRGSYIGDLLQRAIFQSEYLRFLKISYQVHAVCLADLKSTVAGIGPNYRKLFPLLLTKSRYKL